MLRSLARKSGATRQLFRLAILNHKLRIGLWPLMTKSEKKIQINIFYNIAEMTRIYPKKSIILFWAWREKDITSTKVPHSKIKSFCTLGSLSILQLSRNWTLTGDATEVSGFIVIMSQIWPCNQAPRIHQLLHRHIIHIFFLKATGFPINNSIFKVDIFTTDYFSIILKKEDVFGKPSTFKFRNRELNF